ncbi:methyltransferase domain-containing protein [Paenibacillaceae sp. P-4]|uniref:methyltransferase domain-containing protein n=1 Tax=Paenibacillaceae bacterium P-4 TaxID=3160969 RepID=UPI00157FDCC9
MSVNMIREKLLFLNTFFRTPKQIGSITPSSRFLAQRMMDAVDWQEVQHVAELGAGTGAITRFIDTVKRDTARVILFEKDPLLLARLQDNYPEYAAYPDAGELGKILGDESREKLDCVLSGLPFFNFPQQLRDHLIEEIYASLKPGGLFVAFQYSQQMKPQLARYFDIENIHFVFLNVPPAFVYVCRKGSGLQ